MRFSLLSRALTSRRFFKNVFSKWTRIRTAVSNCLPRLSGNINAYVLSLKMPFAPPGITLKEVHDAVPKHLLKSKSSARL